MDFNEYQKEAASFARYPTAEIKNDVTTKVTNRMSWIYPALALAEEAGEVAGKCAKAIRDENGRISEERKTEIKKELGDCLWMISAISTEFDFKLSDVAETNIRKLTDRKRRNVLLGSGDNR